MVPIKRLAIKFNLTTTSLLSHATPVQKTDPVPQGNDTAVAPSQFQPVKELLKNIVGYIVGAKAVGDTDKDADEGEGVGAVVGFDGQLLIPCLNTQRAFASDICWADPVGARVGGVVCL